MKRLVLAPLLALALAACGDEAAVTPRTEPPPSSPPATAAPYAADAVVLRVSHEGGFKPPVAAKDLPLWTLYGDGRITTQGPVPAIFPGPALPNVVVARVSPATVDRIAREARAAGIGTVDDWGRPDVIDPPDTVFRLTDREGAAEARVYALDRATGPQPGLTAAQVAARKRLAEFHAHLTDLNGWLGAGTVSADEAYRPESVAVFAEPYRRRDDLPGEQEPRAWRGPDLVKGGCVVVTGAALERVLDDARRANELTPWTHDDTTWALGFRPLLPDERACPRA
jgi:hypothetical protein